MLRKGIMPLRRIAISAARITLGFLATTALISLTSCSGMSGMSGGGTGATITASFAGATMPSAVAYQVGTTGTFQTLALSGPSISFTLPSGTDAYGFAYRCPTFIAVSSFANESIIQATTTDTTSLSLACPSLSGNLTATYDASAIPGATSVLLYVSYWADQIFQTSGYVGLSGIPTGTFDVALVAEGTNGALALQIQRGVSVTGSTTVAFPPMSAADELGAAAPVTVTGAPSGATNVGFFATYNTSGGLSISLPGPFNGVTQSTYRTAPGSQSQSGDFYLIQASAQMPTQSISAEVSSNTASAVTVALPSPMNSATSPAAAAFPTFNANVGSFTVAGTVVDSTSIQFQSPAVNPTVYNIYTYVTKTWLGVNPTVTMPDLSMLTGFAPAPPSGGREFWSLYSTSGTPLQFNPVQQSGIEALTSPLSAQSVQSSGFFTTP